MADNKGFKTAFADRVIERTTGCWNCRHFGRGDIVRKHMAACRQKDEAARISALGYLPKLDRLADMELPASQGDRRYQDWLLMAARGEVGICMIGAVEDDFVHVKFSDCTKWEGAQGASVGRSTDKLDKPLAEVIAEVEAKAKPVK